MPRPVVDPIERFHRSYVVDHEGCWLWILKRTVKRNFPIMTFDHTRQVRAHRWAYETFVGPIPEGYDLDHLCHTRAVIEGRCLGGACKHRRCVNPAHLEPVTHVENARRQARRKTC